MLDILIRQAVASGKYVTILKKSGEIIENVMLYNYDSGKSVAGKFGKMEIDIRIMYDDIKDIKFQKEYKS